MPYVTVGKENSADINLYYEDHGSGKPVVLIHGYPLSGRAWEKQVPVLIDAGYRVITYDRRGFGQSSQPWSGYNYDTFAGDLHKLIASLDLHDVTLIGHSMGGGEVARHTGKYGTKSISKLVFISGIPPYLRQAPDNPEGLPVSLFEELKKQCAADRPAFLFQFCNLFFNYDVLKGKLVSEPALYANFNLSVSASPKAAFDCIDTWGTDFRNDLKHIDVPALVIQGDQDRIVPFPNSGKRMAEFIKGSKLVVVEGAPHGVAWTHADVVNRELLNFLGKAAQKPSEAARIADVQQKKTGTGPGARAS
jgi:non-heme chloroperoxidase